MADVNIALIGYKFMGRAHSNAYRQVKHFFPGRLTPRLKVICGRDLGAATAAADQLGWEEVETDWRKAVARKDIDVVDISTPGDLHPQMAIAAAAAKKHIICEKPLANSLADAKRMLAAVEKAGIKHMVMHNYRRVPAVALAKQMIANGRIGEIRHYHGAYLQDWITDPEFPLVWRLQKKFSGSGALGDIGSHAIDLARYLNSEFESVVGQMTTFIKERPLYGGGSGRHAKKAPGRGRVTVDDDSNFLACFKNGSVGVFESSRFCAGRRNYNTFQIYGSKGSLAFNLERMNELEFYDHTAPLAEQGFKTISVTESVHPYMQAWWPSGHIIGYEHTFTHAIHDFLAALEKDEMPSPNFADGVQNQIVLDAIEHSAQTKRWQRVAG
jgi:predicted dehydrogenase